MLHSYSQRLSSGFPTQRRLHFSWEYRRFFNQSQAFRLTECVVFRVQNDLGYSRLGITLKARGSSPERNQVKRQIRESFRGLGESLGSFDYNVVISQSKKMSHPYPQALGKCLRGQLLHAISRY